MMPTKDFRHEVDRKSGIMMALASAMNTRCRPSPGVDAYIKVLRDVTLPINTARCSYICKDRPQGEVSATGRRDGFR